MRLALAEPGDLPDRHTERHLIVGSSWISAPSAGLQLHLQGGLRPNSLRASRVIMDPDVGTRHWILSVAGWPAYADRQ